MVHKAVYLFVPIETMEVESKCRLIGEVLTLTEGLRLEQWSVFILKQPKKERDVCSDKLPARQYMKITTDL